MRPAHSSQPPLKHMPWTQTRRQSMKPFFPATTRSLSNVAPYPWILSLSMDDEPHPFNDCARSLVSYMSHRSCIQIEQWQCHHRWINLSTDKPEHSWMVLNSGKQFLVHEICPVSIGSAPPSMEVAAGLHEQSPWDGPTNIWGHPQKRSLFYGWGSPQWGPSIMRFQAGNPHEALSINYTGRYFPRSW